MTTLREQAEAYEPPQTLNIADLASVPIDEVEIIKKEGTKKNDNDEEEKFTYQVFVIDDKEYRVPNTVLEQIQTIVKLKPEVKHVKVNKTGSGLATRYKVEPVEGIA
tara:strand:- start:2218 stop:2538 length:321 start_codon:yes stop_codon:yes gene_type:complete